MTKRELTLNLVISALLIFGGAAMVWGGYGMVM